MSDKTPPFSFSDPDLQNAIDQSDPVFSKFPDLYDKISNDIRGVEGFLMSKGVKCTFVFKFSPADGNKNKDLTNGVWETLDWRYDQNSKKYRLMVSYYDFEPIKITEENYQHVDVAPEDLKFNVALPLIEWPIDQRMFYHPRLALFVSTFSSAVESHLKEGMMAQGPIYTEIERQKEYMTEDGPIKTSYKEGSLFGYLHPSEIQDTPEPKPKKPKKKTAGPEG